MIETILSPASQTSFPKFTIKLKRNIESVIDELIIVETKRLVPNWDSAS